jgi:hypothetical protein
MGRWSEKKNEFNGDVAKVAFPGFLMFMTGIYLDMILLTL